MAENGLELGSSIEQPPMGYEFEAEAFAVDEPGFQPGPLNEDGFEF